MALRVQGGDAIQPGCQLSTHAWPLQAVVAQRRQQPQVQRRTQPVASKQ